MEIPFRSVVGLARKTGVSLKTHCPDNFRGPRPPSLYGKVGLRAINLHVNQTVTSRNFSFARAARATVGFPRVHN